MNISYRPAQDGYSAQLAKGLTNSLTDLTIFVDETPSYLPTNTETEAILNPGLSNAELVTISDYNSTLKTITIKSGGRARPLKSGVTATAQTHSSLSQIIISDNFDFWDQIYNAVNSKLGNDGSNPGTTFDLEVGNFRIRKDGLNMKFKDDSTSEVSLTELAAAAGVDTKVKASVDDTTAGYLTNKLTVSGSAVVKTIVNPGADESINIDVTAGELVDVQYTAGEDLSLGDIAAKSDVNGEVIKAILNDLATPGAEAEWGAGISLYISNYDACRIADNKIAVFFEDTDGAEKMMLSIGTVSGKTITWETPTLVSQSTSTITEGGVSITALNETTLAMVYTKDFVPKVILATVTGTTVSLGIETNLGVSGSYAYLPSIAAISATTFAVAYRATDTKGYLVASEFTGNVITGLGTHVEFEAGSSYYISNIQGLDGYGVVLYDDVGDGHKGKAVLYSVVGNTVSVDTPTIFETGSTTYISGSQLTSGKIIVGYSVSSSTTTVIAADVTSFGITFGSAVVPITSSGTGARVTALTDSTAVVMDATSSTSHFAMLAISGTTITSSGVYVYNGSANTTYGRALKVASDKFVLTYYDTASSNGYSECYWNQATNSQVVGIVVADALSGATVNIRSKGLITNPAWALTTGQTYWFSYAGVSLVDDYGIRLGVAYNATSIDLDIDINSSKYLVGVGGQAHTGAMTYSLPILTDYFTPSAGTLTDNGTHGIFNHSAAAYVYTTTISLPKIGAAIGALDFTSTKFNKLTAEWVQAWTNPTYAQGLQSGIISTVAQLIDYDGVADAVSFAIDSSGALFAHTGNGTNYTNVAIADVTLTNYNIFRIEYTINRIANFYVNGVLEASISATLPDSGSVLWGTGIDAGDTTYFSQINISIE